MEFETRKLRWRGLPYNSGCCILGCALACRPVLIILGLAGWHAWGLMRDPPPYVDEAWDANRAWALLQTGRPFGTMDSGVFERFPGYWTYFPWLGNAIHALAFWIGGLQLVRFSREVVVIRPRSSEDRIFAGSQLGWHLRRLDCRFPSGLLHTVHLVRSSGTG